MIKQHRIAAKLLRQICRERREKIVLEKCPADDSQASYADFSRGVSFHKNFDDHRNLLDTALSDLLRLFPGGNRRAKKGAFPVRLELSDLYEKEAYRIEVTSSSAVLYGGGIEGLRRAVYELEQVIRTNRSLGIAPFKIERKAVIKTRIGRCFCGPINRPPLFHDELIDDFDYYPEAYLSRLAYDGVNGLWISTDFRRVGRGGLYPEDRDCALRLRRLNEIVERCERYGIGIYIFCIEPIAFDPDDPILAEHPELKGSEIPGKIGFCPSSETARDFLYQTLFRLFSDVPRLKGMILLSVGEWFTLCCNTPAYLPSICPRCGTRPKYEALARSLKSMADGMHAASPEAQLISWPYTQIYYWGAKEAREAASHVPDGVILQHNFEAGLSAKQMGKERVISDYWLSLTGPSDFFRDSALRCRENHTPIFAKLQVSCSTECVTTQYLPVPGRLYAKYRQLHNLDVSGVMMCWYFGCYPSIMTHGAGMLSFAPFPRNEMTFLRELAGADWGSDHAGLVASVWQRLSKAYQLYPMLNDLAYIGPMHDSIVWPLHLIPVNRRLAPTWNNLVDPPGDRICECISHREHHDQGVSLEAMSRQICKMARDIQSSVKDFSVLRKEKLTLTQRRQLNTAEAWGLIFAEAGNIFRFYELREKMIFADKGQMKFLNALEILVHDSIAHSRSMLPLIAENPALGYHPESEDYKFNAAMIRRRIRRLERLLAVDFPDARKRLAQKKTLYPEYRGDCGKMPHCIVPPLTENDLKMDWCRLTHLGVCRTVFKGAYPSTVFVPLKEDDVPETFFRFRYDGKALYFFGRGQAPKDGDCFSIRLETRRLGWHDLIRVDRYGRVDSPHREFKFEGKATLGNGEYWVELKIPLDGIGVKEFDRMRLNVERSWQDKDESRSLFWIAPRFLRTIFVLGNYNPADFGWLDNLNRQQKVKE